MITIQNLHKSFDDKRVLEGMNLEIPAGKTTVVVGCSGCGKSVLLKLIMGLLKADRGHILVDDEDITRMGRNDLFRVRKKFGMLFQGAALFDSMTVDENIGLALREHTDLPEDEISVRIKRSLDLVGLADTDLKQPAELSGGMKKRVGLARALIMDPQYVLFDEPTTGLDPIMADNINDLIVETNRRLNITSIVVTHDMESAFKVGNHMAMISNGKIVYNGTVRAFQKSRDPVVTQFREGRADLSSGSSREDKT